MLNFETKNKNRFGVYTIKKGLNPIQIASTFNDGSPSVAPTSLASFPSPAHLQEDKLLYKLQPFFSSILETTKNT
jgi:hypothetical protein